LYLLSLLRQQ